MAQFPPGTMPGARDRAAFNLQQYAGPRAAPQINQLQQQGAQQRSQGVPSHGYPMMEDRKPPIASLSQAMPQAQRAPVNPAQTDGASDSLSEWKAEVARRRELAAQNPGEGDRLIREYVVESQQRFEGGGLMLPLDERRTPAKGKKRKVKAMTSSIDNYTPEMSSLGVQNIAQAPSRMAQGDAAGDDDDSAAEVDEDAINSDLDDPDQPEDGEDNEENTDEVMLCTYDKVQRVKNKWKCTLKDGILRVNSNE